MFGSISGIAHTDPDTPQVIIHTVIYIVWHFTSLQAALFCLHPDRDFTAKEDGHDQRAPSSWAERR